MTYLLDINALMAAIWKNDPDHATADVWLAGRKFATCPISQLGFLRISTHPKALNADMTTARQLLEAFLQKYRSQFMADDLMIFRRSNPRHKKVNK